MKHLKSLHLFSSLHKVICIIFAILVLGASTFHSSQVVAAPPNDFLSLGQALNRGETLNSLTGKYRLILQLDGNLVQYNSSNQPIWYTGILDATADYLIMQHDGNLVLYNSSNQPVWYTGAIFSAAEFVVQDDGNMVMYAAGHNSLWTKSLTTIQSVGNTLFKGQMKISGTGGYYLIMQQDGNLVFYNTQHQPLWTPGIHNATADRLELQSDGNLVLKNTADKPVWSAQTTGINVSHLAVQADGNLVIYNYQGIPIWHR